ncbi:MAG: nucleotidyltransferase family protein [Pseudomonadota bacterium]
MNHQVFPSRQDFSVAHQALFCLLGASELRNDAESLLRGFELEDWERLAHLALVRHRAGPIVWENLKVLALEALGAPVFVRQKFEEASLHAVRDALVAKAETVRITRALNDIGIEPICLKGWPLEEQLKGSVGRRTLRDLDLIVAEDQMMATISALDDLGYECIDKECLTSQRRLSFWLRLFKHIEFMNRDTGFVIDLHARPFANRRLLPTAELKLLRVSLGTGDAAAYRLLIPDPASNFLYLSVHGFLHRWERLKWLVDIPPLVALLSDSDWLQILERTKRLRLTRPVGTALALTNELLGMDIPPVAKPMSETPPVKLFRKICVREILAERNPQRTWRSLGSITGQLAAEHGVSTDVRTFFAGFGPKLVSKQALKSSNSLPDDWLFTLYLTRPISLPSGIWRMFRRR